MLETLDGGANGAKNKQLSLAQEWGVQTMRKAHSAKER